MLDLPAQDTKIKNLSNLISRRPCSAGNVGIGNTSPTNTLNLGTNPAPDAYGRLTLNSYDGVGAVMQASGPNEK